MKNVLLVIAVFVTSVVFGADVYFETNGTSTNWSDAGAWTPTGPPSVSGNDNLIITIKTGDVIYADNLTFSKQTKIIIEDGATLEFGDLMVNVDITAGKSFILEVVDGGILIVNGSLSTGKDTELTIDGDALIDGNLELDGNSKIVIDLNGVTGGTLTVTGNLTGKNPSKSASIDGQGVLVVGGLITNVNDISGGSLNYSVLPIELVYFEANADENKVNIKWQTATEENNDYFTIERSVNGVDFEAIAKVLGVGNSSIDIDYSYVDNNPLLGVSYYRLRQTDYNGTTEVFDIVSVNVNKISFLSDIALARDGNQLVCDLGADYNSVKVEVVNSSGIVLLRMDYGTVGSLDLNMEAFTNGICIVRIYNESGLNYIQKVVK